MYTLPSQREFGPPVQAQAEEPLGTDSHQTISKWSNECWLLIGRKKCFVLLCPIGEQHLLSSSRRFVHDGYWLDHGFSGSCTKEMQAVRKLSVWYKLSFQNTVYPKTKDAFPKIQAWAWKVNSHFFSLYRDYSNSLTLSNASELFWSWISINHIQVHEENEFCHCLFTSFTKREIRHFHVVVVQWRQRNIQKSVMHMQRCRFALLLLFLLSCCRFIFNFLLFTTHCDPSETEFSQCKLNCSCW